MIDEADVQKAWDRNAPVWTDRVRAGADLYREVFNNPSFVAFLPDLAGREVIDLGCGEGRNTRLLAERGARMTGIDISAGMIEAAQVEEARRPLGIEYRIGSFSDLSDFPDEHFDAAVSTMAFMDSPDFEAVAGETFRVLRSGCTFAFSVLHPCFITPTFDWIRDENGREKALVVGRYFDEQALVDRWRFTKDPDAERYPKFEVPRFPRTLGTYINGLIEAGFVLARIEEPRPTEALANQYPWLQRWRHHAAIFLYLAAEKPRAIKPRTRAKDMP